MAVSASKLEAGAHVGGYALRGMLGKGGMGAVYLAEQLSIGREVALKIMHPARMATTGALQRFLTEARNAARLQHQNLVTIHEAGFDKERGLAFYSMDYVHGRTLRTVVNQGGAMDGDLSLDYARQIAQALAKAHAAGIVHRDVKPENVLVEQSGRALLTDLGLAMDRVGAGASNNQRVLSIVGTPGYSAPEQARDPQRATTASDVFALGATLVFMLTGQDPFAGDTVIDLIVNVCTERPAGLDDLPPTTRRVLERFLAVDPTCRPQAAAEAHEMLCELSTGTSRVGRRRRPARRRR